MKAFFKRLNQLMALLSSVMGMIIVFVAFMQVFSRYILGHAFTWPEEICCFLFMWCSLFGMVIATSDNAHLRVDALVSLFSQRVQVLFLRLAYLVLGVFSLCMIYLGYGLTLDIYEMEQYATALPIPIWTVVAIMPVAFFLNALFSFHQCVRLGRRKDASNSAA
ncbi:MAG: TRAP transporter small permease [Mailhella sp.]